MTGLVRDSLAALLYGIATLSHCAADTLRLDDGPVARARWDAETGDGLAAAANAAAWGDVDIAGAEPGPTGPALNGTELATVRELLEERFGPQFTP